MKLFQGKRKRKILFLVLFLACVGFGVWSIFMDSSDSINVVTQLQQQQNEKPSVKVTGGIGYSGTESGYKQKEAETESSYGDKGYSEKAWLEAKLQKANEQAKEVINDIKEKINTTDTNEDSKPEEEEGSIFDWWWTLVGAYFLFKLFLGD